MIFDLQDILNFDQNQRFVIGAETTSRNRLGMFADTGSGEKL